MTTYTIHGGDFGNYQICEEGRFLPVAFVRRNEKGRGYTVRTADGSREVHMRHMPAVDDQAVAIMAMLEA